MEPILRDFVSRAAAHLGRYFPSDTEVLNPGYLDARLREITLQLRELEITLEPDVVLCMVAMFALDPRLDRTLAPWVAEILYRKQTAPNVRARKLLVAVQEILRKQARGADRHA